MSGTESATATVTGVSSGPGVFQYTVSLTNTGTAPIGIFWFAWDDLPDQDFMNAQPAVTGSPGGWVVLTSTHTYPGGIGYGIEWYTFSAASRLPAGSTTTSFTFSSTMTPVQLAAASTFDPTFQTTSSFVYQTASFLPPNTDPGFNFVVAVACFAAGTMIQTPNGERAVEDLRPGDPVVTAGGETRPIRWVGQRRIDCASHETPHEVWPVRIAAGALARGVPARDLYLSPDHALFLSGVLVPARHLINGTGIVQTPCGAVCYHHVELDEHDVILAESVPVETYLDTGDRGKFDGVAAFGLTRPVLPREISSDLEIVVAGPALASIRRRLAGPPIRVNTIA